MGRMRWEDERDKVRVRRRGGRGGGRPSPTCELQQSTGMPGNLNNAGRWALPAWAVGQREGRRGGWLTLGSLIPKAKGGRRWRSRQGVLRSGWGN